MTAFEKMLISERKQAFITRKEASLNTSEEDLLALKNYIFSEECDADFRDFQQYYQAEMYRDGLGA